jgi:SAM-dependent methyltransferase
MKEGTMQDLSGFNPTLAWEERQRDIAQRMRPQEIADFICNEAPWAQSQHFFTTLQREAGLVPGSRLLDAGCATGQLGFAAAIFGGARVTLLDYSEEALNFAKAVAQELRARGKKFEVNFVRDNLESLAIQEQFDIVTNEAVLEHWFTFEERLRILKEMIKVTRPGGIIIIWVPNNHNLLYRRWIRTHTEVPERAFSIDELKSLFTIAGLEEVRVFPVRAYKSFVHYTFLSKIKWIGGMFWILERIIPRWMLKGYLLRFGYQLVAVGRKPLGRAQPTV